LNDRVSGRAVDPGGPTWDGAQAKHESRNFEKRSGTTRKRRNARSGRSCSKNTDRETALASSDYSPSLTASRDTGFKVPRRGAVAEAELRCQLAVLKLAEAMATGEGWLHAMTTADVAVAAAEKLRSQAPGKTKWARRRQRYRASIRTSAYVTRSTILVHGDGEIAAATMAALKALEAAEESALRHMSPTAGQPYVATGIPGTTRRGSWGGPEEDVVSWGGK
jgi:hypothetical protein